MEYTMNTGEEVNVLFKCNRKQCDNCSYPTCKHTSRFEYAKNKILNIDDDVLLNKDAFKKMGDCFYEK